MSSPAAVPSLTCCFPTTRPSLLNFVFLVIFFIQVSNFDGAVVPQTRRSEDVKFYIYSGNPENVTIANLLGSREDWYSRIVPSEPLYVIMHGFMGKSESKSATLIRDALLHKGYNNIIVVDWKGKASVPSLPMMMSYYVTIRDGVPSTARAVTDWLKMLIADNMTSPNNVHLIGFSLGGQVAGLVGNQLNGEVGRISALDPTNLGYNGKPEEDRLDSNDAKFVFVLHTAGGFLSTEEPIGDVDFYPNGGIPPQPQCTSENFVQELTCCHYIAFKFFAESIYNEGTFKGRKCADWRTYISGGCNNGEKEVMGFHTSNTTSGSFYAHTNEEPPFGEIIVESELPQSVIKEMEYTDSDSILSPKSFIDPRASELAKYNLTELTSEDIYKIIQVEPIIKNVLGRKFHSHAPTSHDPLPAPSVPTTSPPPTITNKTMEPSSANNQHQTNTVILLMSVVLYVFTHARNSI